MARSSVGLRHAGVRGFVPKTTPAARLAAIIREVHGGRRYVDPDIAAAALTERPSPLTACELEVPRAARDGAPVSAIAAVVHRAPGTVRNYLSAAMAELGTLGTPPRVPPGSRAGSESLRGVRARPDVVEQARAGRRPGEGLPSGGARRPQVHASQNWSAGVPWWKMRLPAWNIDLLTIGATMLS